jgi:isocitrate dehydrogenase (NAD+)
MKIIVLEGDGIGPEIVAATRIVLDCAVEQFGLGLTFETVPVGFRALEAHGTTLPEQSIEEVQAAAGAILGPVSHNDYPPASEGGINPSGVLRKRLDLYANVRPARTRPAFPPPCGKEFDLVIVRENTEGFYSDRAMHLGPGEVMPTPDLALSFRKVTREGSLRIARRAFALAAKRPRNRVTAVHKANVLRVSDGLFLECVRSVAAQYPDIEYDEQLIDSMAAMLVRDPGRYDVVVTTNMFGDILSDQASELSGSLGLAASLNAGAEHALAQAQHGSAPNIAGRDIANPSSLIGSVAMLLSWLAEKHDSRRLQDAATAIETALDETISSGLARTPDLGGSHGTQAFAAVVAEQLGKNSGSRS